MPIRCYEVLPHASFPTTCHPYMLAQVCNSYLYSLDSVLVPGNQGLFALPQLAEYNPNDKPCSNITALDILKSDPDLSTTYR